MLRSSILAVVMLVPASSLAQFYGTGESRAGNVASSPGSPSPRTTVAVDCANPRARVRSIADGLRMLDDSRPATLLVSGTCRENVSIQGLDRITIQGNPTATIDGGTDPSVGTVELTDSSSIDLVDLTITGGGEGVGCVQCLARLTRVTIRGSLGLGVTAGARSHLVLSGTSVSDNGAGGAFLNAAATLLVVSSSIGGNAGHGIDASLHATVVLNGASVTGNAADGMTLQGGSAVRMTRSTVKDNQGHQVRLGDLSFGRFGASNTVSGATFPDVLCEGAFPATRGTSTLSAATTNCPGELPSSP